VSGQRLQALRNHIEDTRIDIGRILIDSAKTKIAQIMGRFSFRLHTKSVVALLSKVTMEMVSVGFKFFASAWMYSLDALIYNDYGEARRKRRKRKPVDKYIASKNKQN
jgi:hypothetical protein